MMKSNVSFFVWYTTGVSSFTSGLADSSRPDARFGLV